MTPKVAHINGRPVLQPNCNRTSTTLLERRRNSLKDATFTKPSMPLGLQPWSSSPPKNKTTSCCNASSNAPKIVIKPSSAANNSTTPPPSPNNSNSNKKLKSPRTPSPSIKTRSIDDPNNGFLNSSSSCTDKVLTPKATDKQQPESTILEMKKLSSKKSTGGGRGGGGGGLAAENCALKYSSSLIVEAPGSIAAARREQVALMQVQRKMRIAHYGRTKSAKFEFKEHPLDTSASAAAAAPTTINARDQEKRCNFMTTNSDPIYVAYHDEEWGVPVHDDKMLFELLVLTGAQIGSDWNSVLKKRQDFRDAFSGFDEEIVSKYSEKKISWISANYGIEDSLVRGVVDNSNRILETKREFGSFDKYIWGFVNHKAIATQHRSCFKIPAKTSKSEAISKDMVRRGFRLVGPTVIHSFMQAAGLTNDHIIACPRHLQCLALATHQSPSPPLPPQSSSPHHA